MPDNDVREQYQTRYGTFINEDSGGNGVPISSGQTVIADNVDAEGQITNIRVFSTTEVQLAIQSVSIENGEDAIPFDSSVNTVSGATPTPKLTLVGNSEYAVGDFEDPAAEVGARRQIQVVALSDVPNTETVAVNVRTDEHLG